MLTSADGLSWNSRNSGVSDYLSKIVFGNGLFVAGGEAGTIITSGDTVNWTKRVSGVGQRITGLAFGNGLFVGGLAYGGSISSTDGINWIYHAGDGHSALEGVAFGDGLFAAAGWADGVGAVLTSLDGSTWARRPVGITSTLSEMAFGAYAFVAVGSGGTILQSDLLISGTPEIVRQPASATAFAGGSISFEVTAFGSSPLFYQWRKNGAPLTGATNSVLLLTSLGAADAGSYSVLISNSFGTTLSQTATLVVEGLIPPGIAIQAYAGLSITGIVGGTYAIDYKTGRGPTDDWHTATNIVLTVSPQVWIDFDSVKFPSRIYRAVLPP